MALLLCGKLLLVTFMVVVMGVPLVGYMKRDAKWDQGKERSVENWYKRLH